MFSFKSGVRMLLVTALAAQIAACSAPASNGVVSAGSALPQTPVAKNTSGGSLRAMGTSCVGNPTNGQYDCVTVPPDDGGNGVNGPGLGGSPCGGNTDTTGCGPKNGPIGGGFLARRTPQQGASCMGSTATLGDNLPANTTDTAHEVRDIDAIWASNGTATREVVGWTLCYKFGPVGRRKPQS